MAAKTLFRIDMPPFIPTFCISRSQSVRIGKTVVPELNSGDIPTNPQSGQVIGPAYVDLGNPLARRDYQHHNAIGALIDTGAVSNTVYSDLFNGVGTQPVGLAVSAGTGFALNVSAGAVQGRYSGAQINIPAVSGQTLVPAPPPAVGGRTDAVVVNSAGQIFLQPGANDTVAPVYDAWSVAVTGGSSTFKLAFTYGGYPFITGTATAVTATAATLATNVLAAVGGPNNCALSAYAGVSTVTGSGGALGTAPAVLTTSGGLEGPITNMFVRDYSGTAATFVVTHTATGTGVGGPPSYNGSYLVLANVYIPSTATSAANYVISTGPLATS